MNINHFSYFIETVRENSITRAAESLFISQSTISKAIKNLEQTYNTELIDRKARKFTTVPSKSYRIIRLKRKCWRLFCTVSGES